MIGTFSNLTQAVAERRFEIGVRQALGARPGQVIAHFLLRGMMHTGAGILVGGAAAVALTRFLRSLLYDVEPIDAAAFATGILVLMAAAALACWIPARRAVRVDPVAALRRE